MSVSICYKITSFQQDIFPTLKVYFLTVKIFCGIHFRDEKPQYSQISGNLPTIQFNLFNTAMCQYL